MIKNNKGVTIVELIVSATLLFVILTFLFQIIIMLKEVYSSSGIKTEMLTKQALISKMINDDLSTKKIELASDCSQDINNRNCLYLYFEDGTQKKLEIIPKTNNTEAAISYGNNEDKYKVELVSGANFGSYHISYTEIANVLGSTNNAILNINIPIMHPSLGNDDYGINIVYQYNSNSTSITDLAIDGNTGVSDIYLVGSSIMTWYNSVPFEDPGYFYLDQNKNLVKATTSTDAITVTRVERPLENKIIITYKPTAEPNAPGVTREVTLINSVYNFGLTNNMQEFVAPISGIYTIQLWGADGNNSTNSYGGYGAYTSGQIFLTENEKIYIYVGGTGVGDTGGYNGGGSITTNQSSLGGAAGGGATDIRLVGGNWDSKNGLNSRIMVAAGGGGATNSTCGYTNQNGGNGGTLTSFPTLSETAISYTLCDDYAWNLAYGATQLAGGSLKTYAPGSRLIATSSAGKFGMAGVPTNFENDIKSGGGGGYYGGSSAGTGSFATGGSSYVSGCELCKSVNANGDSTDNNIHYSGKKFNNIIMLDGNDAQTIAKPVETHNGYAQITLAALTYGNASLTPHVIITNKTQNNLSQGDTLVLNAVTNTGKAITWSSSDTSVATVSATGIVTGISNGTVAITATSDEINDSIIIFVKEYMYTNNTSTYSATRPANTKSYLRYASNAGVIPSGTQPQTCVYNDLDNTELCLNYNDYENSLRKIKEYFGYDSDAWIRDTNNETIWYNNATHSSSCTILSNKLSCDNTIIGLTTYEDGAVYAGDQVAIYSCGIRNNNPICGAW